MSLTLGLQSASVKNFYCISGNLILLRYISLDFVLHQQETSTVSADISLDFVCISGYISLDFAQRYLPGTSTASAGNLYCIS